MRTVSVSLSLLFFIGFVIVASDSNFRDCGPVGLDSSPRISITDFALFPNPAQVHQNVHLRAVLNFPGGVQADGGFVSIKVYFNNDTEVLSVNDLDLCTLSPSVPCPLGAPTTTSPQQIISFDWMVPALPTGSYTVTVSSNFSSDNLQPACVAFTLNIKNDDSPWYHSWYEAKLAAATQYQNPIEKNRQIGDVIQVGPEGYMDKIISSSFPFGAISFVQGSEDLVPPYVDTSSYLWGMYGNLIGISIGSNGMTVHEYYGNFFVGYSGSLGLYDTMDTSLFSGTFNLTWQWNVTSGRPSLSGVINVLPTDTLPGWWPEPLTFGRLNPHTVYTDDTGILRITASRDICVSATPCPSTVITPPQSGYVFNDTDLGLTLGLILGFAFLVVLILGIWAYRRHRRQFEEEDGVFSVSRKPEYGSALVVDDIVQESRGHNGPLLPRIDRRRGLQDLDLSEFSDVSFDEPRHGGRRGSRRSRRSASGRRDSSRSRSRTPSGSRSRVRSVSSSRSISPARDDDSISRSRSRRRSRSISSSESDHDDAYSVASDSSRSRSIVSSRSQSRSPSGSRSGSGSGSGSRSPSPSPSRSGSASASESNHSGAAPN